MWYFEACGDPLSVRAVGNAAGRQAASGRPGMYDNFSSVLTFPGGRYATITQSLAGFEHHSLLEITGDRRGAAQLVVRRRCALEGAGLRAQADAPGMARPRRWRSAASGEVFELEEQIRQTVEAFRARRTLVSGEEARKPVVVCLEAERSVREGREIELQL